MILILAVLSTLQAPADTALASFVARARAGTEALRHPDAARLAGYHPVGPDFPGMGRHWIHTALILRPIPDAAQPPVLEYAEIDGVPTLVGVAYAVLVSADTAGIAPRPRRGVAFPPGHRRRREFSPQPRRRRPRHD